MPTIVVFGSNGARIYEGAEEATFKGQSYLVSPEFPKGVPPHLWKLVDGKIEGTPTPLPVPRNYTLLKYLGLFIAGALLGYFIR